jgi:hypothetical protein
VEDNRVEMQQVGGGIWRLRFPGRSRYPLLFALIVLILVVFAAIAFAVSNHHVVQGIGHGWQRDPVGNDFNYHVWTQHGHGANKFASLEHSDGSHTHCASLGDSDHVHCERNVANKQHESGHDVRNPGGCDDYADGHGICIHLMEAII